MIYLLWKIKRAAMHEHIPQRLYENEKLIFYRDEIAEVFAPYVTLDPHCEKHHIAFLSDLMEKTREQLGRICRELDSSPES